MILPNYYLRIRYHETTVTFSDFVDAFRAKDRYDQFGYQALRVLFDYLEQYEQDTGEELELDVIALCCDYTVDTWENIARDYSIDLEKCEDEEAKEQAVIDYMNDQTMMCGVCVDGIVYT